MVYSPVNNVYQNANNGLGGGQGYNNGLGGGQNYNSGQGQYTPPAPQAPTFDTNFNFAAGGNAMTNDIPPMPGTPGAMSGGAPQSAGFDSLPPAGFSAPQTANAGSSSGIDPSALSSLAGGLGGAQPPASGLEGLLGGAGQGPMGMIQMLFQVLNLFQQLLQALTPLQGMAQTDPAQANPLGGQNVTFG